MDNDKVKQALEQYRKERRQIDPNKKDLDVETLITAARITNAALLLAKALDEASP